MRITEHIAMVASGQMGLSCPWDCHVYAIDAGPGLVLIDAGSGIAEDAVMRNIETEYPGKRVLALLLSHAHADHAAGAPSLAERFGCEVYSGPLTSEILAAAD